VATALISAAGAIAALGFLLAEGVPQVLALPLGLPGAGLVLALDSLAAFFLLQLFLVAIAAAVFALDERIALGRAMFPVLVAVMGVSVLAADGWTLMFGFELTAVAGWVLMLAGQESAPPAAVRSAIGMAIVSGAALVPALALLAPAGFDLGFASLRAGVSPEGWRAAAVLVLAILGVASQAGLAPLHRALVRTQTMVPSAVAALMSGTMPTVALYVLIRVLFDLAGASNGLWWGVPLVVLGATSAVLGSFRCNIEAELPSIVALSSVSHVGLVAVALGLALVARAADLPALAALALGAAMLLTVTHGTFRALLMLAAGAVQRGAGSRHLDRLGGLIHRMPWTAVALLAGGLGVAALPPGPGFASEWLLFQSALGALRIGGLGLQTLLAVTVALMALAAALTMAAVVRLIGIGLLGRARTPRAAAADEIGRAGRLAMGGLFGLLVLMALLPGPILGLTEPTARMLTHAGLADRASLLVVAPAAGQVGYAAPAIMLLLLGVLVGAVGVLRLRSVAGYRQDSAWGGGFAPAPAWLPFGDPATQFGSGSFSEWLIDGLRGSLRAQTLRGILRRVGLLGHSMRETLLSRVEQWQSLSLSQTLAMMLAALALLLAMTTWLRS
jgi:hydrogenase-4 component B